MTILAMGIQVHETGFQFLGMFGLLAGQRVQAYRPEVCVVVKRSWKLLQYLHI
jgi:hypothetical protein